jgi:hypothetical protein
MEQSRSWEAKRFLASHELPAFYGTRKFRHLSLSWARSSQFVPPPPFPLPEDPSKYYPPIYAWVFQVVSFLKVSPPKSCVYLSFLPYMLHAPPVSFSDVIKTYLDFYGIWNFTYCVRKSPPLFSVLIQMNSLHVLQSHFEEPFYYLSALTSSKFPLFFRYPQQFSMHFPFLVHAICHTNLFLLVWSPKWCLANSTTSEMQGLCSSNRTDFLFIMLFRASRDVYCNRWQIIRNISIYI